jgi:hypothetical protein
MFGQVIPFRARRAAPAPANRVHRSLSAALAEVGLVEPPPLAELTVEPEAGVLADEFFPEDESFADEPPPAPAEPVQAVFVPASRPVVAAPAATVAPIPQWHNPAPAPAAAQAPVAAEPPLPRVIARATRHPPNVASYPWVKSARRRRFKTRLSDTTSWLVTIAIMAGMIGVAATYLSGPRGDMEPVAQR